jgi:hypothetical protein
MMTYLTEEEWEERFVPIIKRDEDCLLFSNHTADESAFLAVVGNNRIWTQIEADDGIEYIPGFWRVNAEGYIVTMNPWAENEANLAVAIDFDFGRDDDGHERGEDGHG